MAEELVVVTSVDDEVLAVSVSGELDGDTSADMLDAVAANVTTPPQGLLVMEMSKVTYIDSSGVSALVFCSRMIPGRNLEIRNPSRVVRRLLFLTALDNVFTITDGSTPSAS